MEQEIQPLIYSVSELTKNIKKSLETNPELSYVWVKGEISNLTLHSSGHIYFTLKDENAVIQVTFFRNSNKNLSFKLEEGMSIFAFGNVAVFEKRGNYQLNVSHVKLEGIGELQKKIDELKKKLLKEGVFDADKKQALPFLPKRLGIVTSPTGAAVRDIIKVALRRYPNIEIILAPAKVQGDDAPISIVRAIEELNRPEYAIDLIIAGRGGGSFEDLMPFNEEIVVRAFAGSQVPIISAVGHQIDHPLSDDAADLAAPTPSAAAEMSIPLKKELFDEIEYLLFRTTNTLNASLRHYCERLTNLIGRRIFTDPMEIINKRTLMLRDLETKIISYAKENVNTYKNRLLGLPPIASQVNKIITAKKHAFQLALQSLEQLSPLAIMARGYAIPFDQKDTTIKDASNTQPGEFINLHVRDGLLECTVNTIHKGAVYPGSACKSIKRELHREEVGFTADFNETKKK